MSWSPKGSELLAACEGGHRVGERLEGRPTAFYIDQHYVSSEITRKNGRFFVTLELNVGRQRSGQQAVLLINRVCGDGKKTPALAHDFRGCD